MVTRIVEGFGPWNSILNEAVFIYIYLTWGFETFDRYFIIMVLNVTGSTALFFLIWSDNLYLLTFSFSVITDTWGLYLLSYCCFLFVLMFFLFFSLFFFWINPKLISPSFSLLVIHVLLFLLVIILGITMFAIYFLSSQLGLGPWNTLFFYLTLCCLMSYYVVYIFIYFKSHKMLFLFCAVIFLDLPNIGPSHYSQFLPTLLCFHLQSFSFCLKNFSDFFFFFFF